jgi:hypothetical protein
MPCPDQLQGGLVTNASKKVPPIVSSKPINAHRSSLGTDTVSWGVGAEKVKRNHTDKDGTGKEVLIRRVLRLLGIATASLSKYLRLGVFVSFPLSS